MDVFSTSLTSVGPAPGTYASESYCQRSQSTVGLWLLHLATQRFTPETPVR